MFRHPAFKTFGYIFCMAGMLLAGTALAASTASTTTDSNSLGYVAQTVTSNFKPLAQLITASAYIIGLIMGVVAIMKFKQHKDNPTQMPVGTPVMLIFLSAALLFLPSVYKISGGSLFGTNAYTGTVGGVYEIPGEKSS